MSYASSLLFDLSPVRINYVGALRGLKPLAPSAPFVYAQTGSFDAENLICIAASNPQGQFYGVVANALMQKNSQAIATERKVGNISFVDSLSKLPMKLDYLCTNHSLSKPTESSCVELFSVAETRLAPGGFFCFRYRTYDNLDETLQFLVDEYSPNMSEEQSREFLHDLKALGSGYFVDHPITRTALDKAIEKNMPSLFFDTCSSSDNEIKSGTFETMAGLLPREFSFVGDADFGANYIELAAPADAHTTLDKCRDHLLYEPIKDFVLQRLVRNDVWVKRPVEQTFENPDLFGLFTFGITGLRDRVPTVVPTQAGAIHLTTPLFTRLIDLMTTMPIGIGDFLSHPAGQGMNPDDVVSALNVLVACGILQPMRGRYEGKKESDYSRPVWSNSFNEYLNTTEISSPTVRLASPIIGSTVTLSAKDALVLQAVNRVGIPYCAGALLVELKRIIQQNPALASQIIDSPDPTDEVIHNIVTNVLTNGMTRWYAYGLLAA
jgi:hypothetical protein